MDEREALRRANENFYLALESRDLPAMDEIWLHETWVQCVHPGWDVLVGWKSVRRSFEEMFTSTRGLQVTPTSVREVVLPALAIVSCAENLTIGSGDDLDLAVAQATNLFQRTASGWKMIHHHASSAPVRVTQPFTGTIQ